MDLNLLRTFVAVYESRSLTSAAARLYVTQPAVSQALTRMRRQWDDPLFHRVGRTMEPTAAAHAIYPSFRDALMTIDRALDAVHSFDPATSDRRFTVAMSELGEIGYFPALFATVRSSAPNIGIDVVSLDLEQLPEWLARGTVDLAVTSLPIAGSFEHRVLKSERYAVLMGQHHPLAFKGTDNTDRAAPALALDDYLGADHAVVAGDSGRPALDAALRRLGAPIHPAVSVRHFASLPPLLSAPNHLIATVPASIARGWAETWPVVLRDLPFELPGVEISLLKRTTSQHTAALDWFHGTVLHALRGDPGEFSSIGARKPGAPH
ncbi:LysR family transcriptional regulator [Citricoccus muralis]|uniref:DNA-binding transcriptional LysR family regulator n=1 Tax=Citricoccus muralis TaxID=169134 RepID=A0A3D9LFZ7_9MICC|nr:LysR family transcriptional regulator [Citricoccus muralis]REE05082.1 DNA-binding transcriptional LysR family regulator [Citricoccus muralis]